MGIDTGWKKVIEDEFTWPEFPPEAASNISVVLDDISLNLRRLLCGIESWADLGNRLRNRIEVLAARGALKEYRVMWDEPRYVPRNKGVTQRMRDHRSRAEPFTTAEQEAIVVGVGTIPQPTAVFFERLLTTRSMHAQLHTFIAAELALTNLPSGTRLVLEGARARGIMARQMAGAPVLIMNVLVPENEYQVLSDNEQARIDNTSRIIVTRSATVPDTNSVFVHDSPKIGESDLKIPAAIAEQTDGAQIFVRSCDTDMLVIILLHMKNYFKDGMIKYGICLDTEGPGRKSGAPSVPPLDMVELYVRIILRFREMYPTVPPVFAIETLSMLMLMSGSDYADRMAQVGVRAVWDTFVDPVGRSVLFPRTNPQEPAVVCEDIRGQPLARDRVRLHEVRIQRFVAYMYHKKTLRNMPFPETATYTLDAARDVRVAVRDKVRDADKKETAANSWQVPSDNTIAATVRRLAWNIDYFANGSKVDAGPFLDPVRTDPESKKSIHGWIVTDAGIVDRAEVVHTW